MSLRGCFVTGTDTNVGKTRISAGLLHWLTQQGVRAAGFKPVAAGTLTPSPSRGRRWELAKRSFAPPQRHALASAWRRHGWGWGDIANVHGHRPGQAHPHPNPPLEGEGIQNEPPLQGKGIANEDVQLLRAASAIALTAAQVGPCVLAEPCAPTIAAALEGRVIERKSLHAAAHALAAHADFLVIEGVGGFCVPLGDDWDSADLALDFALPVVLVVGLRLGCINHALLSAEAITRRGLRLAGWVGNTLDANLPWYNDNLATLTHELKRRHQSPCLGVVPWLEHPAPATVAPHFNTAALQHVFFKEQST